MVQYQTLRTLLAIYAARDLYFGQIDVETTYMYAFVLLTGDEYVVGSSAIRLKRRNTYRCARVSRVDNAKAS